MISITTTATDITFLIIVLLSAILSFQNGLAKEVMKIFSWLGAVFITMYAYEPLVKITKQYIQNDLIATGVTIAVVFLFTIVILYIISSQISSIINQSIVGSLNKSLGFLFGVTRGLVIMSILYMALAYITNRNLPDFIYKAKSEPVMRTTSKIITVFLPSNMEQKFKEMIGELNDSAEKIQKINKTFDQLNIPKID